MMKYGGQKINNPIDGQINIKKIIKGLIFSYIITIPIFIIFAFILSYTSFPERLISPVVLVASIISIMAGGIAITINIENKGFLSGGISGFIYMITLYLISSLVFNDYTIDRYVITMTLIGIFSGSIGGILGVNLRKSSRSKLKVKRR